MRALAIALSLFVFAPVSAQGLAPKVLIADPTGAKPEAPTLGMLLRSMFKGPKHAAVTRRELYSNIARIGADASALVSGWNATTTQILKELGADRLVRIDVSRNGDRLVVTYNTYSATGDPTGAGSVVAPINEMAALVAEVAKRLAADIGADVDLKQAASYAELRPYAGAADVRAGDSKGIRAAARALSAANPEVAQRIPAAREAVEMLRDDPSLPAANKVGAAIALGDNQAALNYAQQSGADEDARAQAALIKLASNDLAGADIELRAIPKARGTLATLAQARLAHARKPDIKKLAKTLTPLLAQVPAEPALLSYVATLPPGLFGPKSEQQLLETAKKSAEPLVLSALIQRASAGGLDAETVFANVKLGELNNSELGQIAAQMEPKSPAAEKLKASLDERSKNEGPRAWDPSAEEKKGDRPGVQVAKRGATKVDSGEAKGSAVKRKTKEVADSSADLPVIAEQVGPLLGHFPELKTPGQQIRIKSAPTEETGMFTKSVLDRKLLRDSFIYILAREPLSHQIVPTGGDYELRFDASHEGRTVTIKVSLFDAKGGKLGEKEGKIDAGFTGLVTRNTVFMILMLVIGLSVFTVLPAIGFFLYRELLRVGSVVVDLRNSVGSVKEAFHIQMSRKPQTTIIKLEEAAKFDRAQRKLGPNTGWRSRPMAAGRTNFTRIPIGKWYVHVWGLFELRGEPYVVNNLSRRVDVIRGQTVYAQLDIRESPAQISVRVLSSGRPLQDAHVIIEDAGILAITGKDGTTSFMLPLGEFDIKVDAQKRGRGTRHISVTAEPVPTVVIDVDQPTAGTEENPPVDASNA